MFVISAVVVDVVSVFFSESVIFVTFDFIFKAQSYDTGPGFELLGLGPCSSQLSAAGCFLESKHR